LLPANLALDAVLVIPLDFGAPGLMAGTSACSWLQALLLRQCFSARCGAPPPDLASGWRIALATAAMAGAVIGTSHLFDASSRTAVAIYHLALPMAAGAAVYGVAHLLLGGSELRRLAARLRR
jgi:peptidoglycan biosynthesis protein MviN/MurJ (putative lipid II flippase)